MTARVAILSDVHGNAAALDAVRKAIRREKPDAVIVAGDLVLNGPDPVGAVDGVRELEAEGAIVVQGNTDVAVADFDYSAAFPWMTDGSSAWSNPWVCEPGDAWQARNIVSSSRRRRSAGRRRSQARRSSPSSSWAHSAAARNVSGTPSVIHGKAAE